MPVKVGTKTLQASIDFHEAERLARSRFDAEKRKQFSFADWVTRSIPYLLLVVFAVFYLLSASHTVEMVSQLNQSWGWLAPIGFEVFILILAVVRHRGWRTASTSFMLYTLLLMSIVINVLGGFVTITHSIETTTQTSVSDQTILQLLNAFPDLPATAQTAFFIVIPLGILVPIMAMFVGEAFIKFAMGELKLSRIDPDAQWSKAKREYVRQELIRLSTEMGATPNVSETFANQMVEVMYAQQPLPSKPAPYAPPQPLPNGSNLAGATAHREMGFGLPTATDSRVGTVGLVGDGFNPSVKITPMTPQNPTFADYDRPDSSDNGDSTDKVNLRVKDVIEWANANRDELQQMINASRGRRTALQEAISVKLINDASGFATVRRALKEMGIDY